MVVYNSLRHLQYSGTMVPGIKIPQIHYIIAISITFLRGEILELDEQIVAWDLRTIGVALTTVTFLVGTLSFLSINFVSNRPRS